MGGRGGRGRGRGRGGGRGGQMGAMDLLRDTAEDIGLDSRTFYNFGEGGPPPLFPAMELPPPIALTQEEAFVVQKSRELAYRIQNSPYFLKKIELESDIERYSDRNKKQKDNLNKRHKDLSRCLINMPKAGEKFFPDELVGKEEFGKGRSLALKRKLASTIDSEGKFKTLAEKESEFGTEEKDNMSEDETFEQEDGVDKSDSEEGDYAIDHYESADSDGGDDDNEPAFN
mmetsp:Transcript_9358/g.12327  ORF Transcript_9358/g.12327 Transcript_9358/m.12327 type:complete len:229 (+) Transcript_9358:162-848(+)|eukprot:CAMPEP_0117753440 /NCGR_PEP_ID=MMETSP0947-20121206/12219_1 /TAXON_ID=44440 /ORGANISM="Chattonella subsalsa, Strain CCMP2191" /LENGTH=228 /DNA_ID=CAMNT_0005572307 /DNA_START=155 /DNA_END=841 /DNA_ORIENTATION=-